MMKQLWSVAAVVALVFGISAVTLVAAEAPVPAKSLDTAVESAQVADAVQPMEIPEALKNTDLFDGQSEVVFVFDGCTARKTCPDGCVIVCSGSSTCSVGSSSVTCDGHTHTCSGPRLCPF